MKKTEGQLLGQKLIAILGLPPTTGWFELRVSADEVVTIKCGYKPDTNQDDLVEVLAKYELRLIEQPEI